jgi:hypothetical protein
MNEEQQQVRRVPAQPGWVVDMPNPNEGEPRILWAVVQWAYDPDGPSTSALCLGPLGYPDAMELAEIDISERPDAQLRMVTPEEFRGSTRSGKRRSSASGPTPPMPPTSAPRPLAHLRVSAICPVCQEGELARVDGPPEWYVLPAATLGLPDDAEKRVGRGMPVGVSVCSRCEHVALFLPPTVDRPEGRPSRQASE